MRELDRCAEILRKANDAKGKPAGVATVYDANPNLKVKFDSVLARCAPLADRIDHMGREVANVEATVDQFRDAVAAWYRAVMEGFRTR